jgi:hypothetical protein
VVSHPLAEAFFEAAQKRWPRLTARQFGDAARAVVARLQEGSASISEMAQEIEVELRARYGEGDRCN